MHRNQSVNTHQFAMVPRSEIPRSSFKRQHTHKTTFDAGLLIPIYVDEVLPGDTFNMRATFFARMATPLYPLMDNLYMDTHWFFVPNRLVWRHWKNFMGEKASPSESTEYVVPTIESPVDGYEAFTVFDYMGLPTVGQVGVGNKITHSALYLRAYNLIWNEWYRDENLQDSVGFETGDSDSSDNYALLPRNKRHDYFTSCLPFVQKGPSVSVPLGTTAPVESDGSALGVTVRGGAGTLRYLQVPDASNRVEVSGSAVTGDQYLDYMQGLQVNLSEATAATINQLRQAFQIQKLLERDARGGTRYTELVRSHFGVMSPDARLQRPEYLGGSTAPISVNPIAQTSASGITGSGTALGDLGAFGTVLGRNGFSASFTEHGMIIGLVSVRADLTYQQGLERMWSRSTRYDFYWPAFAALGEQAVLSKEIYCTGGAGDEDVFGYQERWAEYRYKPSKVTGYFRSTDATPLDGWHLAQEFGSRPTLNTDFIEERPPMSRVLAVGEQAGGKQFIFDGFFDCKVARPMPLYSVPGLIDHF